MIKKRWLPFHAVVALGTTSGLSLGELLSVYVLVALFTLRGCGLEIYIKEPGFEVRRLMTADTRRSPMRSQQRKTCLGMVESGQFFPRFRGMAGFASGSGSIRSHLLHAFFELPFMGIIVATGAGQILPVIDHRWFGLKLRRFLVALSARSRHVTTRQSKLRLPVFGQCERGRLVPLQIVAAVARIEVRRRSELSGVPVAVTVGASLKLHLEQRVFSFRNMALRALQTSMTALQRIAARCMFLHRESRRLPALSRVARRTLASIRTLGELPVVGIGLVAVRTLAECQRLFKVAIGVALRAVDAGVFAFQRILGLRVIETLIH